jgi:hypothetical protein
MTDSNDDRRDAELYLNAQSQTIIDLFEQACGRPPATAAELGEFLEEQRRLGRFPDGPIQPTPEAIAKVEAQKALLPEPSSKADLLKELASVEAGLEEQYEGLLGIDCAVDGLDEDDLIQRIGVIENVVTAARCLIVDLMRDAEAGNLKRKEIPATH